jgi:putative addiction module component (TIGR02574 family)
MVQISEILKLNTEKRIELVELIWDSVEKDSIDALPNQMKLLLDERIEDLRLNPNDGSSWEEVFLRVKNRV